MFSVIVAWFVFIFVSICIPLWIYKGAMASRFTKYNWPKIIVYLTLWFVSGVYLFG